MDLDAALLSLTPLQPSVAEQVAVETAVALTVNGISQAVMMASPTDLEDFALGFGLAEGWLAHRQELLDVEALAHPTGLELALTVTAACEQRLKARRRTLAGRTGCGLCGIESLAQLQALTPRALPALEVAPAALQRAVRELPAYQPLNTACGGMHAAAWCTLDGEVVLAREDLGRHNALDKLTGALARQRVDVAAGFVLMSSRASYELVQKAATAGAGLLACVSAPSSLAVQSAQQCGLQLWAFVRGDRATRYT
ncbi:formate dehydrogenase accessory sulfurtransferase FdhD [Roseateles sp. BYS87W]|uniref:Sulfur carrier protein FdhD n=1 Tax=Pelomonas baiyunensis TaxID=3299026 RepID=A0ABW7GWE8_9BURK